MCAALDSAVSTLSKMNKVAPEGGSTEGLLYYLSDDVKSGIRASNKSNTLIMFGELSSLCSHLGHMYQGFSTLQTFSLEVGCSPERTALDAETLSAEELDLLVLNSNRTVVHRAFLQETLKRLIAFGLSDTFCTELCMMFELPSFGISGERDDIVDAILMLRESGLSDALTDQICRHFQLNTLEVKDSDMANVFDMESCREVRV